MQKEKKDRIFPLFIFWAGIGVLFFNPPLGLAVLFVAAISLVFTDKEGGLAKPGDSTGAKVAKNTALTFWIFAALVFIALLFLLGG